MNAVFATLVLLLYGLAVWMGLARAGQVLRARKTGEIKMGVFDGRTIYRDKEPGPFRRQLVKAMANSLILLVPLALLGNLVLRAVLGAIARQ